MDKKTLVRLKASPRITSIIKGFIAQINLLLGTYHVDHISTLYSSKQDIFKRMTYTWQEQYKILD